LFVAQELMNSFEMANNSSPHDHSPTGAVRLLDDYIVEVNPIRGGMEYAASILANRVSSYGTAPYVDLVVINGVIVLVTQRIQGINLKQSKMMEIQVEKRPEKQPGTSRSPHVTPQKDDPSQLKQSSIDQRTFTEAVIMAIILSSLDGAPYVTLWAFAWLLLTGLGPPALTTLFDPTGIRHSPMNNKPLRIV
jgi:hypothetical protein